MKKSWSFKIFYVALLLLVLLLIPALSTHAAESTTSDVTAVVERIQKKFASIHDLSGSFGQMSYIKDIEETQKFSGTFFIKKPSSMMWQYASPRDEQVTIRDTETWIYKKSENQVIKTRFSKESYSQVPIALLTSVENISNDFDITMPEQNALQLVPKRRIGFIRTLVFELSSDDFPVKMFTIIDTYDNVIMVELADVKINQGIDDARFNFKTPPGAEVYEYK